MLTSFIILSLAFCRAGDGKGELLQGFEVVAGEEYVDVRERCRHSTGQGPVAGFGLEGVHPDHPAGKTREALHALREHFHVSPVPAVREDDDHGAAGHAALSPQVHELLDGVAESGSPDQSSTAREASPRARSGSRSESSRVTRVSLVPRTKASTGSPEATLTCMNRKS